MSGRIDLMSAFTASFAMLAALNHRQRTGEGQHNEEVYSALLGYPKEDLVRLREAGII